jgi:hypothetical protein
MRERPTMWSAILGTQWRWTRALALIGVALGFALPVLSLRTAAASRTLTAFVNTMQAWGVGYAIAAAALGMATAVAAWSYDHRLRHVYALSLPIPRWRYVALRFAAGLVVLAIPVAAVLFGAEIVAHNSLVPKSLHAYPLALTLRFAFAALVAYSLFFAISAATPKTAGMILGAIALLIAAQAMLSAADVHLKILPALVDLIFAAPGLLAVFAGRWALIDV